MDPYALSLLLWYFREYRRIAGLNMLTIRNDQMSVFSEASVKEFSDWTLVHLRKFFPKYRAASDYTLRELIEYGIARARVYRVTARREVCRYIDLMAVFGRDFDTDPQLPWAAEILQHPGFGATRIPRLMDSAQKHLRR